ncbi:methyltransferase domain-containing protein [Lipingzhangella sp. LS1_29]|uniref:Protein-L-isoaspartate O-methyltransferase n=1 Tax=Lipingzhangella rawalii TaxID=2055835 RepID=A0ABU2HBL6_9ACTN|nr:methyltransferase domain-containing protein [Lipingzhangella rawalii]MDS1272686.1 methyltransferase domain-containing protein [Lipingzhangella rawalii]
MVEPEQDPLEEFAPNAEWAAALRAAPREWFVPERAWVPGVGVVDRQLATQEWRQAVQRDVALVTQIVDGDVELTTENVDRNPHRLTSSSSAPSLVFDMLRLLDPYPGDRVLEVGTGTGWTAALLSAYLGAQQVTSIEVDEQIAAQAKEHLDRAGFTPRLVVGDGTVGDPDGTPFDRIHVTCGVVTIPYTWVEQARPGGIIVVPWSPSVGMTNLRTRLTVTDGAAIGRFHRVCAFMPLRAQRDPFAPIRGEPRERSSAIDPRRIAAAGTAFEVALAGLLPGVSFSGGGSNPVDSTFRATLREWVSDSHAIAIQPPTGGTAEVRQRGPRNLWDELEAAFQAWVHLGEPALERLGLTVNTTGQHIWLDSPNNQLTEVTH